MRKYFFLLLLPIIIPLVNQAQNHSLEYGFTGGLTINSSSGSGVEGTKQSNFTGMSIGGQVKLNTSHQFGFRMIAEFAQLGWKYPSLTFADSANLYKGSVTFKMSYFNVPIMAEFSFGRKLRYYFDGGLFVGVLLKSQNITKLPGSPTPNTTSTSSDYRKKINYGLAGGIGLELPLSSKMNIHLSCRDMAGLANVYKQAGFPGTKIILNSLSVNTGIAWRIL